ncbi:hypothetical protein BK816_06905 [Boudabousia tangfeifanii]|uniref:Uncharacterized protein n=1 Tax=Boudabousia tangfeifanii TaxID=1912795 RepID=A0A1D9MLD1_9ACTO|nr:hypothetical protein BK816_06905 [Boudabousia tangfeifanii]
MRLFNTDFFVKIFVLFFTLLFQRKIGAFFIFCFLFLKILVSLNNFPARMRVVVFRFFKEPK